MPEDILKLPFDTEPLMEEEHYELIGNPRVGILKIKKEGDLLLEEKIAIETLLQKNKQKITTETIAATELNIAMATILLKSRHDKRWTEAKVRESIKHEVLLNALVKFLENESAQWVPTTEVKMEGVRGREAAIAWAESNKQVVFSRKDLPFTYLVVDSSNITDDILLNWDVVESFSETPLTTKKNKRKE